MESIIQHRYLKPTSRRPAQFLIKWAGYPVEQASWRTFPELQGCMSLLDSYLTARGLRAELERLRAQRPSS